MPVISLGFEFLVMANTWVAQYVAQYRVREVIFRFCVFNQFRQGSKNEGAAYTLVQWF
jgi:hypothetical protein